MSSDIRLSEVDETNPTYLLISSNADAATVMPLTNGVSVFVGSGPDCKIRVTDESVQQLHCIFIFENNVLKIQDWNTGATFLNDAVVTDETQINSGDVVTIGNCRMTAVLDVAFHHGFAVELLAEEEKDIQLEPYGETNLAIDPSGDAELDDAFDFNVDDVPGSKDAAAPEDVGFKYDFDADLKEAAANPSAFDSLPGDIGFGFDSVGSGAGASSSLSTEVDQLRFQIADRDSQILAMQQNHTLLKQTSTVDESDTLKLVSRLEDLLVELQTSDERVQSLEDLLRVAEDATIAEREERSQIDKWLVEIEKRVAQREAEAQAEIDGLTRQLQFAQKDAGVIQTQLESISASSKDNDKQNNALAVLNEQVEDLRDCLQKATAENLELLKRPVLSDDDLDVHTKMLETQDELAKYRLEASRERAEMARRHAELEGIRDELELRMEQPARDANQGDSRIRAMREHLKEIHAEEAAAKAEKKSNSLGGRITNLLTRLR